MNITVDGIPGSPPPPPDTSQWHLPTYDPRNENKYHYRLHSLDIYFWMQADALQFVNGIRRVLPAVQVEVADEPVPPPSHSHGHRYSDSQDINPLVQRLESAAISGSVAQQYQQQQPQQQQQGIPSFAPPPPPLPMNGSGGQSIQQDSSPQSFAPMAYNPQAPPEREKYQHREKTPPPEDDGHDPLAAALARDQAGPFSPGYGQTTFGGPGGGGPMSPGLPPTGGMASPGFAPPPSQYGHLQRSTTMPVVGSPGLTSPYGAANYPGSPSFAPPPTTATTGPSPHPHPHAQQTSLPYQPTHTPNQSHATPPPATTQTQTPGLPPPPPGGYSQYSYNSPPPQAGGVDYGIHQQVYRPTSQEHANHHGAYKYKPKPENEKPSKLGQNAERLERGVTGMLKKFEKKFG